MTETETKRESVWSKMSFKGDAILKWYSIFAVFLFLNLCGVGYAYYYKFYRNKDTNLSGTNSSQNQVRILPPDTLYVDAIDDDDANTGDENQSEEVKEVLPVSHIERASEKSFSMKYVEGMKALTYGTSKTEENASDAETNNEVANNNKAMTSVNNTKPVASNNVRKSNEDTHTFMISLGMFEVKENALNMIADLKQKGVEGELISSNHFAKLPPSYILVLGGKELSSASAYQMCTDMKKKGIDCYVQDGGKYSWK